MRLGPLWMPILCSLPHTPLATDKGEACLHAAGFSDASFATDPAVELGPLQKREHLHAFFRQQVLFGCQLVAV